MRGRRQTTSELSGSRPDQYQVSRHDVEALPPSAAFSLRSSRRVSWPYGGARSLSRSPTTARPDTRARLPPAGDLQQSGVGMSKLQTHHQSCHGFFLLKSTPCLRIKLASVRTP